MSIHDDLAAPFKQEEVEFRLAQCGKSKNGNFWAQCLAYITSRAIMDRLDQVCGPECWKVSYDFVGEKGVLCSLSLKINGEWVTKQDGADMTAIEAFKGGISSALKRAGSAWGMGRYLYSLEAGFAKIVEKGTPGAYYGQTKEKEHFYWLPETLPVWALPKTPIEKKPEYINDAQVKRLLTIATENGWNYDRLHVFLLEKRKIDSVKKLKVSDYDTLCEHLQKNPIGLSQENLLEHGGVA